MSADNQNETSQENTSNTADESKGTKDGLNTQLAEVQEQLRNMNAQMEATQKAIADANKKPATDIEDDNIYDPKNLLKKAEELMDRKYRADREKDIMIYNLAQEYPEIQTKAEIRQAVIDAQKTIPETIRDTAVGFEMAVLKAVTAKGLIAKSRRPTIDEDVSIGSRSNGGRAKGKVKVSEKTLAVAQLLGRDITDEKVLKGLEEASNRDSYSRYR